MECILLNVGIEKFTIFEFMCLLARIAGLRDTGL